MTDIKLPTRAEMLARCFEIARECLAGDPLREVPALELESDRLSYQHQGRDFTQADVDESLAAGLLPAFEVADNVLGLAGVLVSEAGGAHG